MDRKRVMYRGHRWRIRPANRKWKALPIPKDVEVAVARPRWNFEIDAGRGTRHGRVRRRSIFTADCRCHAAEKCIPSTYLRFHVSHQLPVDTMHIIECTLRNNNAGSAAE